MTTKPELADSAAGYPEGEMFDLDLARRQAAASRDETVKGGRPVFFASERKGKRLVCRRWPDGRVEVWREGGWEAWRAD